MSRDMEIEIKLSLGSFTNYLKLIGSLGQIDEERHQTNAFFDTPELLLRKDGWVLRVRDEETRGLVTVKGSRSQSGPAVIRQETEEEIERGLALEVIRGFKDVLELDTSPVRLIKEKYPGQSLAKVFGFQNLRQSKRVVIHDVEYKLEIDKTEFSDGSVDYELEVEMAHQDQIESVNAGLQKMFASLAIPFEVQRLSKSRRAFQKARLSHS